MSLAMMVRVEILFLPPGSWGFGIKYQSLVQCIDWISEDVPWLKLSRHPTRTLIGHLNFTSGQLLLSNEVYSESSESHCHVLIVIPPLVQNWPHGLRQYSAKYCVDTLDILETLRWWCWWRESKLILWLDVSLNKDEWLPHLEWKGSI